MEPAALRGRVVASSRFLILKSSGRGALLSCVRAVKGKTSGQVKALILRDHNLWTGCLKQGEVPCIVGVDGARASPDMLLNKLKACEDTAVLELEAATMNRVLQAK